MADLPADRATPDNPPFSYVGVDCFGPFVVKRGRSQLKRYGCLFTYLTMRAIHKKKSLTVLKLIHLCRPGIKCRLRVKYRLRVKCRLQPKDVLVVCRVISIIDC